MIKIFSPTDKIFSINGDVVIQPHRAKVHKEGNRPLNRPLNQKIFTDVKNEYRNKKVRFGRDPGAYLVRGESIIQIV